LNSVEAIVKSLNLEKLMKRYPYNLSGGEKQKVAMARAVAGKPDLLILDEPLSSLDPATYSELSSKLLEMSQKFKLTTIHICHNMREASALSDRVGIMLEGKLVLAGKLEEILKHTEIPSVVKFLSKMESR